MDPILIDADEKHRAPPASLRSPDFRRMLALTWPHRRRIAIGLIASVVYGALHSVSIIGMLPVLTVMVSDEGLHGWAYRSAAEDRLDAELNVRMAKDADPGAIASIDVLKTGRNSPLRDVGAFRRITRIDGTPADSLAALQAFLTAGETIELELAVPGIDAAVEPESRKDTVRLDELSIKSRFLLLVANLIPRESTPRDRIQTLVYVLGFVAIVVILSNVARFVGQYFIAAGVLRGVMDLRRVLYRKVLRLPMDFFSQNTSDLVSRFVQDMQEIQRGLTALFGKLVREPVKAAFVLAAALILNAQLTLTLLVTAPVVVVIFWAVGRKIRKANKRLLRSYGDMIGALTTSLQSIAVVKAYNAENVERKRLWKIDRRMFTQQMRIAVLEAFLNPLLEVLAVIAISIVTVWLGSQVITGQLKLAEFGTVLIALGMLMDPLRKFADVYPRVMRSAAGARRIFSVVDAPEEAELLEGAVELPPLREGIEFRNVTFRYAGAEEPALRGVDLTIRQGETVAIVGPNGSGKTTLTRLIIRFHDPQEGAVLFDGVDVRKAVLRSLRRQVSVVTQDPVVFAMTVAENIAYGTRNGDAQAVVDAARHAHADEFIRARPAGYDERIGERGTTLSGGQRQRICIARAMMRNAPILIFDEATSQIDSESERQIQDAIREYAVGRTTILIAHRLSTIRFASRVVVMDGGMILDSGTHDELIERCPLYATLCRTQLVH